MTKTLKLFTQAILITASLIFIAACGNSSKSKNSFVTSPTSCFNYTYNQQFGYYTDKNGQRVNCEQGQFTGLNNIVPYQQSLNGQQYNGCAYWSTIFPGSYYVPVNVQGRGYVCVKQTYFYSLPGFQTYYNYYGTFPMQARSCQVGTQCGGCYNRNPWMNASGQVSAGINVGGAWLGGTLALCW